ncbi:STAS domain-containing protein [Psychrobacillus sp. NEAU-3TGS]|uniref:STAS domain-containing protein n=1 Tax=Psychrobacillus sp. NEAU-3TGS TaxID=2995412 RepID=UPI002497654B|nr:STAS domain-containing protein [Psychrobacillus sp. NEAU-3TGS]MDI2586346.1 STAS domain-containing protein [Psychrobacillus sp. NEAU-3TGS]
MSDLNKELYNFIIENKSKITEDWLASKLLDNPSYATTDTEVFLRTENGSLIEAISSVYIQDKKDFRAYIENRAFQVAEMRVEESFPLYESVHGFNKVRKIFWNYVEMFIEQTDEKVSGIEVAIWSDLMNSAIDYIVDIFAKHHHEYSQKILVANQALITELSSTVIPIKEGIGVLPLVGSIDDERAKIIFESTLAQSSSKKLKTIFIDFSAVPVLDSMVANQLYQLLIALKLIGVEAIYSGIRPELAQSILSLEIDLTSIKTYSSLMQALKENSN